MKPKYIFSDVHVVVVPRKNKESKHSELVINNRYVSKIKLIKTTYEVVHICDGMGEIVCDEFFNESLMNKFKKRFKDLKQIIYNICKHINDDKL